LHTVLLSLLTVISILSAISPPARFLLTRVPSWGLLCFCSMAEPE